MEIKKLKESLKSAKDDYERSVIHTKIASIELYRKATEQGDETAKKNLRSIGFE